MTKNYKRSHSARVKSLLRKPCPEGKIRNEKTGYCSKKKRTYKKKKFSVKKERSSSPIRDNYSRSMSRSVKKESKSPAPFRGFSSRSSRSPRSSSIGTQNKSLESCINSKKRLQKSVLRLAAKLSVYRKKSFAKNKAAFKRKAKRVSNKKKSSIKSRTPSMRSRSLTTSIRSRSNSSKGSSKSSSRSRTRTSSHGSQRASSDELQREEARIRAIKAARLGQEDDWFAMLAKKYGKKSGMSDSKIEKVLKQAERDAEILKKKPVAATGTAAPKKRIVPTFVRAL